VTHSLTEWQRRRHSNATQLQQPYIRVVPDFANDNGRQSGNGTLRYWPHDVMANNSDLSYDTMQKIYGRC